MPKHAAEAERAATRRRVNVFLLIGVVSTGIGTLFARDGPSSSSGQAQVAEADAGRRAAAGPEPRVEEMGIWAGLAVALGFGGYAALDALHDLMRHRK
ncbi:hypothetical protein [Burkholderia pseudomultivorans]|uniref:Uncharacterized protein n=1 Tax=Burkholderia pseudomultivorans TaxID=1207504 RepID=A0A132ELX9_9BURK|nr:hypothetical protein [Burkholderia pseudomultivorans]KWF37011.1 hypothetical protein WT56_07000 [Burkholderia pseudomultivorans]